MDITYEACAVLVVVAGLLAGALFSTGHRDGALWGTCTAIVLAIVGGFAFWQDALWEGDARKAAAKEEEKTANLLTPGGARTPDLSMWGDDLPSGAYIVLLGQHVAWTESFPFTIVRQAGEPMIVVDLKNGELALSAKFFNPDGTIVCEIEDNQIHLNKGQYFRIVRESPHELTVINHQGRPMFTIDYLNERCVRVLGDFHLRGGFRVVIDHERLVMQNAGVNAPGMAMLGPTLMGGGEGAAAISIDR